jgi:hypothetical protein
MSSTFWEAVFTFWELIRTLPGGLSWMQKITQASARSPKTLGLRCAVKSKRKKNMDLSRANKTLGVSMKWGECEIHWMENEMNRFIPIQLISTLRG